MQRIKACVGLSPWPRMKQESRPGRVSGVSEPLTSGSDRRRYPTPCNPLHGPPPLGRGGGCAEGASPLRSPVPGAEGELFYMTGLCYD